MLDAEGAFAVAALVVNRQQSQALAALLTDGRLMGTTYANVAPPQSVALVATSDRLDGMDGYGPAHTLGVLADDGRTFSIVAAGITWPHGAGA